ncbi:trypsin-like serine protease [Pseudoalteromonas viridis]|uniref:Trypsin-like serine protease n=1 Tax=Pseudoalteromonas viridis TaxID=339617 RepID=A0ABX7V9X7_9GAMM|nr:trypsin-like serine protease [Pseudoalteromonas viridis]QTL37723.1 trypsin-like serine protease [Pseudoalteromonas viridis]
MKITLLAAAVLSLSATAVSANTVQPGSTDITPSVVGGIETPAYSRPYQVALLMNGRQGCGGTLLSENWVLTAAHCLDNASTASLTVRVGAHSISRGDGDTLRVSQIIMHENWRGANGIRSGYDIAVLRLATPAASKYTPAKLPTQSIADQYAGIGDYPTVSGWGLTSNRGRPSDVLREAQLPVISNASCSSQLNFNIPGSVICGGGEGGRSACNGDSGGPYAVRVGNDFYSIGTVSWGIACSGATAFTRTTSYLDWIERKTGLKPGNPDNPTDEKPVADFSSSVSGLTVSFANRATDDNGITAYDWNFGDGNRSSAANPRHTYAANGSYNVTLTVTDTAQQTASVSKVVSIGEPPVCDVEAWNSTTSYALGDKVSYQGSIYEAIWWSSGAQPDVYPNVWKKLDNCDGSGDPAPVANFTVAQSGLTVTLNNTSTDNGQIVSSQWQFGDGQSASGSSVTHTYRVAGSYTIRLTVADDQGQSSTVSKTVTVGGDDNCQGIPGWDASAVYNTGDRVAKSGVVYEAQWWVQGEDPAQSGPWGPWKTVGACN